MSNGTDISDEPLLIQGDVFVDDRGPIGFVNGFDMAPVRRFYTVANHRQGFIRAWHAHEREEKYVTVVNGSAIVAAVHIDDRENPSRDAQIHRHVLSARKPGVLFIPRGFANGFKTLTPDAKLMFFSTATLEESQGDDIRYDAYYWNPWDVVER